MTYARSELSGEDEFFQFIILRAKVTSENTITLEAEGDPSVFNLNLRVLRGEGGQMMKLVKYNLTESAGQAADEATTIIHNHVLTTNNESDYTAAYPGTWTTQTSSTANVSSRTKTSIVEKPVTQATTTTTLNSTDVATTTKKENSVELSSEEVKQNLFKNYNFTTNTKQL